MGRRRCRLVLCGVLWILLLGLGACADDPATPPAHAPHAPFPATPDSLVSLYRTALAGMDSSLYQALLAPGFQYRFSPGDTAANHLPTDYMTRTEALRSALNMFGHVEVTNSRGEVSPPVARIMVFQFDLQGAWEDAAADAPFPGTRMGRHFVRIHLEGPDGLTLMSIMGDLDVYAQAVERTDGQGRIHTGYQLAGLADPGTLPPAQPDKLPITTWGLGFFDYLDNAPPVAVLQVRGTGTFPEPGFELNALGSEDTDSGLPAEPYRWRAAADSAWTAWSPGPLKRFTYADTGRVTVGLEVRDRWGLASEVDTSVVVPVAALPFPGTPDLLMANLRTVFDNRVTGLTDDLLAPGHVTYLDSTASQAYPELQGVLDRQGELTALGNLFSGDDVPGPDDQTVPAVDLISFQGLFRQDQWATAGAEDRVPGALRATYTVSVYVRRKAGNDLQVDDTVVFYATARDSSQDGEVRDYWQLAAQDDLGPAGKVLQPVSWSGLKALYRSPSR